MRLKETQQLILICQSPRLQDWQLNKNERRAWSQNGNRQEHCHHRHVGPICGNRHKDEKRERDEVTDMSWYHCLLMMMILSQARLERQREAKER